jgi:hypothetical protein
MQFTEYLQPLWTRRWPYWCSLRDVDFVRKLSLGLAYLEVLFKMGSFTLQGHTSSETYALLRGAEEDRGTFILFFRLQGCEFKKRASR